MYRHFLTGLALVCVYGETLSTVRLNKNDFAVENRTVGEDTTTESLQPGVMVMGQFNYQPISLDAWVTAWSKVVPRSNIIVAAPIGSTIGAKGIRTLSYPADKGYYSPYKNLARAIRMARPDPSSLSGIPPRASTPVTGVLYVHDDMLISDSLVKRLGGDQWILTNHVMGNVKRYQYGTLLPIPEEWLKPSDVKLWPKTHGINGFFQGGWARGRRCYDDMKQVMNDRRFDEWWQFAGEKGYLKADFAFSDMMYVPLKDKKQVDTFLRLVDLFGDHDVWLECAIPTMVSLMQQRFGNMAVYRSKLCTNFAEARGATEEMIASCHFKPDMYHPVKMGIKGSSYWTQLFHRLLRH